MADLLLAEIVETSGTPSAKAAKPRAARKQKTITADAAIQLDLDA